MRDWLALLAGLVAIGLIVAAAFLLSAPVVHAAERPCPAGEVRASWYGTESGRRTASGMRFDGSQWLVAHRSLPFGTRLRLTYRGRSVVVTVQDRGPFIAGRTLDLSERVARALGTKGAGAPCVRMERLN